LCATVFGGDADDRRGADDEARAIWKRVTGLSDDRGSASGSPRPLPL